MEHTDILNRKARQQLRPHGFAQKGRSRIWLADHGWWLVVVEFQPSSWSKGSYLNVGAMWLTYPTRDLAFHDGYRQNPFESFREPAQFEEVADRLCEQALLSASVHRARIRTPGDAYRRQEELLGEERSRAGPIGPWNLYYTATFAHASGHGVRAVSLVEELLALPVQFEWQVALREVAERTFLGEDPAGTMRQHIASSRANLKLPAIDLSSWGAG